MIHQWVPNTVNWFGLTVRCWAGKQKGLSLIPFQLSLLFKKVVVCGHCLVTLPLAINETLKWLSSLPILMQESFRWWQCSDTYIISLFPHLHSPVPNNCEIKKLWIRCRGNTDLVATWWLYCRSPWFWKTRARPKSASLRCPVELISRLAGFRSCQQSCWYKWTVHPVC